MKIGDKVWHMDTNRRRYPARQPGEGYSSGPPIYREYWHAVEIVRETRVSWVTHYGKLPKKGAWPMNWVRTYAEVDELVWDAENRSAIAERISGYLSNKIDTTTLRKVAELIGHVDAIERKPA